MNEAAFTPSRIGNLEIRNRFVMSAAVDGLAGNPDARIQRYCAFADGGIGLMKGLPLACYVKEKWYFSFT